MCKPHKPFPRQVAFRHCVYHDRGQILADEKSELGAESIVGQSGQLQEQAVLPATCDLGFQPPGLRDSTFLFFKLPSLGYLFWQPEQTNSHIPAGGSGGGAWPFPNLHNRAPGSWHTSASYPVPECDSVAHTLATAKLGTPHGIPHMLYGRRDVLIRESYVHATSDVQLEI